MLPWLRRVHPTEQDAPIIPFQRLERKFRHGLLRSEFRKTTKVWSTGVTTAPQKGPSQPEQHGSVHADCHNYTGDPPQPDWTCRVQPCDVRPRGHVPSGQLSVVTSIPHRDPCNRLSDRTHQDEPALFTRQLSRSTSRTKYFRTPLNDTEVAARQVFAI